MQANRYNLLAIFLHWLMVLCILGLLGLGFYMADLPFSLFRLKLFNWHKWLGVTVFILAVIRLTWRKLTPPPSLPEHMSGLERFLAYCGHASLYALMLFIPISGWLMSSAKGFTTVYLGIIALPNLIEKDKLVGDTLTDLHAGLNWLLVVFICLHVLAALKHHFWDKDDVLKRMMFRKNK